MLRLIHFIRWLSLSSQVGIALKRASTSHLFSRCRLSIASAAAIGLIGLSGCRSSEPRVERQVIKPESSTPQESMRVISLAPSHTEWVFALGAQSLLVGRTDRCDYPIQAKKIKSVGGLFPPQLERILSLAPTDVLMIDGHEPLRAQLNRLNVKVHHLQPHSLEEIFTQASALGDLFNAQEAARRWISEGRQRIKRFKDIERRPRVAIEIWSHPLTVAGAESFMGDLMRVAGGTVVPQGVGAWPTLSIERLIEMNPEVIFVSTEALYQELINQPSAPWRTVKAVQLKQIYRLEGRLARPGPRVIDELEWINERLSQAKH